MSFYINLLYGLIHVRLSMLGDARAGYRGADQRQRISHILQGPRLEFPRDADLAERLCPRGPIVTDIRQTVVDFDMAGT